MSKKQKTESNIADWVREKLAEQRALIIIPKYNTHGKRDVTHAFRPEAKRAAKLFESAHVIEFDNRQPFADRGHNLYKAIVASPNCNFNTVMFFCHGWVDGIQAGFKRRTVGRLAGIICCVALPRTTSVVLYCCSTGDDEFDNPEQAIGSPYHNGCGQGEGSFADKLRDELCARNTPYCRVVGHDTAGHTTKNPNVLFFLGAGSEYGGIGGFRPVVKGSPLWLRWRRALKNGDFRFRFPHMPIADIHAELAG